MNVNKQLQTPVGIEGQSLHPEAELVQSEENELMAADDVPVTVTSWVKQRYHDISPVTLQLVGGAVSSSLYCGEVEGLSEGAGELVESFLVELYRCKLCQFTCGLKTSISGHLILRHRPLTLTYLNGPDDEGEGGAEGGEEAGLQQEVSPYQLDLNGESKQSDEDEDFLLYNMLDNMSPPTCDISTEGGLQVAHTYEVSTLFEEEEEEEEEEESSIFPLKEGSVNLSCPIEPPATQEEMAQSAHLMTLGLCRISTVKPPPLPPPPPPPPPTSSSPVRHPPPTEDNLRLPRQDSLKESNGRQTRTPPSSRRSLLCLLCPRTLTSRQLLDVHVRSHRAAGGFGCVRCSWTTDSWEELELHWRGHCRRRRRKEEQQEQQQEQQEEQQEEKSVLQGERRKKATVCQKTFRNTVSQNTHSQDRWRRQLTRRAERKKAKRPDRLVPSQTSRSQTGSLQSATETRKKTRRKKSEEEVEETSAEIRNQTEYCCSLCHRKFSSKLTLKRHLGIHGGEKPFTCPHCSYRTRLKASLLQHLRTHTGEKPYKCAQCPYASKDRSSQLRHFRTHSQEKPYRCQHCDYSSIQKKSLDLHVRRHHTGEVFPCQQCKYANPDRQLLLRHIRRHHAPSRDTAL
ncbi:PR domain zinc finger protein 5 isoform X2 [Embiotoca jacksoni]|uniref:PR domain zinc finger protein 5 isoform X2 n=1 Tax=Embiotoca jacksoni TaxID=100190 RepID=UPI003704CADD